MSKFSKDYVTWDVGQKIELEAKRRGSLQNPTCLKTQACQLKVCISASKPMIWRQVIPGDAKLSTLTISV